MLGVDIVEIYRIANTYKKYQDRFLNRVFTEHEIKYCFRKKKLCLPELSARFAAKEAVVKALGTGMKGVSWREIEIKNNQLGKPEVFLHERALEIARQLGIEKIHLSLSHTKETAIACTLLEYKFIEEIEEEDLMGEWQIDTFNSN